MKIGIITFNRAINNGAVLQTYALSHCLTAMGYDCEVIDYKNSKIEKVYSSRMKDKVGIKGKLLVLVYFRYKKMLRQAFDSFSQKHLPLSESVDAETIEKLKDRYDILITGSDQVWNSGITGFDENYYLKFGSDQCKKVSYAASFGKTILPPEDVKIICDNLPSFSRISCRESSGMDIVNSIFPNAAISVPDPVFLLERDEWIKLSSTPFSKKYIFYFPLQKDPKLYQFALNLSRKKHLPLITFGYALRKERFVKYIHTYDPQLFIDYILNAAYVVTNSFHACSMSLILNKELFMGYLHSSWVEKNTRLEQLVSTYHLQNRIIDNVDVEHFETMNYNTINDIISSERQKGISFLESLNDL